MRRLFSRRATDRRGFTLTEVAIVLSIAGFILATVWAAASKVYANQKNTTAVQEVITVAQGIRSLYGNRSVVDSGNLTQLGIDDGIYPANMQQQFSCSADNVNPCPVDPWNGEMAVGGQGTFCQTGGCGANTFNIVLYGMTNAQCAPFLAALVPQATTNGLYAIASDGGGSTTVSSSTLLSSDPIRNCLGGPGGTGNVYLQFTL